MYNRINGNKIFFSKAYVDKSNAQIADIVELVRGKLAGGARLTLGALTVIDVHGKKKYIYNVFSVPIIIRNKINFLELYFLL